MIRVGRKIKDRYYRVKLEVVEIDTVEYTVGDRSTGDVQFRRDFRFWTTDGQVFDVSCVGPEKNAVVIRTVLPEGEWVIPEVYKG